VGHSLASCPQVVVAGVRITSRFRNAAAMSPATLPTARSLVLTADPDLRDQLHELCAAAALPVDVLSDTDRVRQSWPQAAAVLVGEDLAGGVSALRVSRRDRVLIVSRAADVSSLWRLAVALGADDVVALPRGRARLSAWLSDVSDGADIATTIGVMGGCGGAGASILAAALSLTAGRMGLPAVLLDADPLGGGIELAVGSEHVPGLRWPEVAATKGRVSGAAFRAALPCVGELAVLSFGRTGPHHVEPDVMATMVRAAQHGARLVVIDFPRRLDDAATDALTRCDLLLLVVTAELRSVASAQAMLPMLRSLCADVRLVVRTIRGSGISGQPAADTLDLPLVATLPTTYGVARAVNDGLGPGSRGRFGAASRQILRALVPLPAARR
jgi:secretion/DNA translocation related CpaE-like protein